MMLLVQDAWYAAHAVWHAQAGVQSPPCYAWRAACAGHNKRGVARWLLGCIPLLWAECVPSAIPQKA